MAPGTINPRTTPATIPPLTAPSSGDAIETPELPIRRLPRNTMDLVPTLVRPGARELDSRTVAARANTGTLSLPRLEDGTPHPPLFTTFAHHPRPRATSQEELARSRLIDMAAGQRVLASVAGDVSSGAGGVTTPHPSPPDPFMPGSGSTRDDGGEMDRANTTATQSTTTSNAVTPSRDHPLGPEVRGMIEHLATRPDTGQLDDQRLLYRPLPESGPGSSLGDSPTYTPRIRTVLPHLLGVDSMWTTELELELLEFVEMCEDYAAECERTALHKHRWNTICRMVTMLCSGSAAVFPHIQNISVGAASAVVSAIATVSLCASVAQSVYHFEKASTTESNASFALRETSKRIRMELAKPLANRWPAPFEKMLQYEERFSEIARKISPKVIDSDVKGRIRTARRQRMRTRKRPETEIRRR